MKTATDPRHRYRSEIMQALFASSFHKKPQTKIKYIWDRLDEIDPKIVFSAPDWPLDKLNPIDLAILRLAVYELLLVDNKQPYKVIIDEAVELAKEYGGSSSPAFINGALGKLVETYLDIKDESKS